jgi:hypothetical protein
MLIAIIHYSNTSPRHESALHSSGTHGMNHSQATINALPPIPWSPKFQPNPHPHIRSTIKEQTQHGFLQKQTVPEFRRSVSTSSVSIPPSLLLPFLLPIYGKRGVESYIATRVTIEEAAHQVSRIMEHIRAEVGEAIIIALTGAEEMEVGEVEMAEVDGEAEMVEMVGEDTEVMVGEEAVMEVEEAVEMAEEEAVVKH